MARGVTLIELVIVLILISVLYLAAVRPRDVTTEVANLAGSQQQIVAGIKNLRAKALGSGRRQKIVLNSNSGYYDLYEAHVTQDVWVKLVGNDAPTVLPGKVIISSSTLISNQLIFSETGAPFEGSAGETPAQSADQALPVTRNIVFQTVKGLQRSLYIVPETGYAYY